MGYRIYHGIWLGDQHLAIGHLPCVLVFTDNLIEYHPEGVTGYMAIQNAIESRLHRIELLEVSSGMFLYRRDTEGPS